MLTYIYIYIYVNIALRRFLHNHGNITTEGSPKPGLCPINSEYQLKRDIPIRPTIQRLAELLQIPTNQTKSRTDRMTTWCTFIDR